MLSLMLNSNPTAILKKNSFANHLKEIKRNAENSVLLSNQSKHTVIFSVANFARFHAVPKIHKPTFALSAVLFLKSALSHLIN